MTRRVRTTLRPDDVVEVEAAEYLDLHRQGLVLEEVQDEGPPPAGPAGAWPFTPEPASPSPATDRVEDTQTPARDEPAPTAGGSNHAEPKTSSGRRRS
ncbi:hypothetical protein [Parafrankia discariae]|uniref:hypothetical protein n=1 Tax=Parafrankia discariae TaxID=365528 RepID=UPI00039AFE1C|nr:hypothetical protein [Parafrankia discariae]